MENISFSQLTSALTSEGGASATIAVSGIFFLFLVLWVIPWKGYALWTAAKRGEKWWFIAFLLVNTLAILEIFYLLKIAKKKGEIVLFFKKKILRL